MKYACAALFAALLLLGWLYHCASDELVTVKTNLAAAKAANEANQAAILRLERSIKNTNAVLAGWDKDRTTLAGVRSATKQAIKEAMQDEVFKRWCKDPAPDFAWRLLGEAIGSDRDSYPVSTDSTAGRLPGNSNTNKRQ